MANREMNSLPFASQMALAFPELKKKKNRDGRSEKQIKLISMPLPLVVEFMAFLRVYRRSKNYDSNTIAHLARISYDLAIAQDVSHIGGGIMGYMIKALLADSHTGYRNIDFVLPPAQLYQ